MIVISGKTYSGKERLRLAQKRLDDQQRELDAKRAILNAEWTELELEEAKNETD